MVPVDRITGKMTEWLRNEKTVTDAPVINNILGSAEQIVRYIAGVK